MTPSSVSDMVSKLVAQRDAAKAAGTGIDENETYQDFQAVLMEELARLGKEVQHFAQTPA